MQFTSYIMMRRLEVQIYVYDGHCQSRTSGYLTTCTWRTRSIGSFDKENYDKSIKSIATVQGGGDPRLRADVAL
jgi:hypothetical protein